MELKFYVRRTSIWSNDRPCEEAFEGEYVSVDCRKVDSIDKLPEAYREDWLKRGTNHRVEEGCLNRDFIEKVWFVSFNNHEEFFNFCDKYSSVVINEPSYINSNYFSLEIYDDYRE